MKNYRKNFKVAKVWHYDSRPMMICAAIVITMYSNLCFQSRNIRLANLLYIYDILYSRNFRIFNKNCFCKIHNIFIHKSLFLLKFAVNLKICIVYIRLYLEKLEEEKLKFSAKLACVACVARNLRDVACFTLS